MVFEAWCCIICSFNFLFSTVRMRFLMIFCFIAVTGCKSCSVPVGEQQLRVWREAVQPYYLALFDSGQPHLGSV